MAFQTKLPVSPNTARFKLRVLTVTFFACLFVFTVLAYFVVQLQDDSFDRQVMWYFSQHRSPVVVRIMRFITFFGSSFFLLPAYLFLIGYLLVKRFFREALAVAIISFLSWLLLSQLKILFHRRRPDMPLVTDITTYSFPSAHAFSSLIFFSILAYIIAKWRKPSLPNRFAVFMLLLCPVLVGLSRIILNVHYPSDVLAGYCLGAMWLVLSYATYRKERPSPR